MKIIILIIAWGIIGYIAAACRFHSLREPLEPEIRPPQPPCPSPFYWKRIIAFIGGIIGGLIYYYFMGFKDPFASVDFIASAIFAAALGRFLYLCFCPIY